MTPGSQTIEEILRNIFENVNGWLRFAEAKNGALIGISLAVLFGLVKPEVRDLLNAPLWVIGFSMLLLIISILVALGSFVPRLVLTIPPQTGGRDSNILFFGHIAGFDVSSYLEKVQGVLGVKEVSEMARVYANQIVINSNIALGKLRLFTIAFWFFVSGLLLPVAAKALLSLKGM